MHKMTMKKNGKYRVCLIALMVACFILGAAVSLPFGGAVMAQETAAKQEVIITSPFTDAVERVHGSVVGVSNYRQYTPSNFGSRYYGGGNRSGESREVLAATGSGTVISDMGHVLTNYHVIQDASTLKVTANDMEYDAQVVAFDEDADVAVLLVPQLELTPVKLGDSDALRIGDWAICIGNPLSEEFVGTTTVGIVSGLNRSISTGNSTDRYGRRTRVVNSMIQVDASINSGNSGGGMFNVLGELVGIPTIKYSSSGFFGRASVEGIGMCIPINTAKPLIEKALNEVAAPAEEDAANAAADIAAPTPRMGITYFGISGESFDYILPNGAYISEVEPGTPAEKAGLLPGDIIVEVDSQILGNVSEDLKAIISGKSEGDTVKLTVYRAEGLYEVMERYINRESVTYNDLPADGDYIDFEVELKILDEVEKQ